MSSIKEQLMSLKGMLRQLALVDFDSWVESKTLIEENH